MSTCSKGITVGRGRKTGGRTWCSTCYRLCSTLQNKFWSTSKQMLLKLGKFLAQNLAWVLRCKKSYFLTIFLHPGKAPPCGRSIQNPSQHCWEEDCLYGSYGYRRQLRCIVHTHRVFVNESSYLQLPQKETLRDIVRGFYIPDALPVAGQIVVTFSRKERKSIYIAPFCTKVHTKCSGMDHTVLPASNAMPAFPLWRSPDVTTTATEAADIQLQLTTHLSTPKGWKAELA